MQTAVERAIDTMWSRYHEPLSLADMADTAILSKFYFSRVFRTLTGTSPGRFLTAIRLTKAKQLLLETSLSVTEISYMVGYNSLGTFTSRFTRSVGVPPARYRALSRGGVLPPSSFSGPARGTLAGSVAGWVGAAGMIVLSKGEVTNLTTGAEHFFHFIRKHAVIIRRHFAATATARAIAAM